MMEHKIEFEKLKEPEDQLAMESVRSNFEIFINKLTSLKAMTE